MIRCIIPGREIPKWFDKVNICDTSVDTDYPLSLDTYNAKKVKIQLPGSGCDEWWGIVLCVVFSPPKRHHRYQLDNRYQYHTDLSYDKKFSDHYYRHLDHSIRVKLEIGSLHHYMCYTFPEFTSEYGEVESHHLWLHTLSKKEFCLPNCILQKFYFFPVWLSKNEKLING